MNEPIIKTNNLTKTYQMGEVTVNALNGVNIELKTGELVVLLGPSGCGKSTLLNILGGLDTATSGDLWFDGSELNNLTDNELTLYRRENIGFVFQMYNLIPRLNAAENVQLVTEISNNPMDVYESLELVGLKDRARHFPSQMSGGEQQRVAIARAIAKQPRLLFCDEPTGALDVHTGALVLEAIQKVNQKLNTTTLIITHNVSIAKMADRIIRLRDGQVEDIQVNLHKSLVSELEW
ncbi:MAG: ABC transporter ATP-binding protein [Bdellovibrionales bacterium]|nr:ABC transporter ATP-binding protein [Bdellovibrionales bacterium]